MKTDNLEEVAVNKSTKKYKLEITNKSIYARTLVCILSALCCVYVSSNYTTKVGLAFIATSLVYAITTILVVYLRKYKAVTIISLISTLIQLVTLIVLLISMW